MNRRESRRLLPNYCHWTSASGCTSIFSGSIQDEAAADPVVRPAARVRRCRAHLDHVRMVTLDAVCLFGVHTSQEDRAIRCSCVEFGGHHHEKPLLEGAVTSQ